MTVQGIVLIDILGLALVVLVVNLVRSRQLYVGYGLIWLFSVTMLMVTISVPPMLDLVTRIVGAVFPVSALSLLAFAFMFLVLIFLTVQLSAVSSRQAELIQSLALRELLDDDEGRARNSASVPHNTSSRPLENKAETTVQTR